MFWIVAGILVVLILYILLLQPYKYWEKKGVKQRKPTIFFGDSWKNATRQQSFADLVQMCYDIAPDSRYCGAYLFFTPILVLRDPDLIKQITVKDFDHFLNHPSFLPEDVDPLWSRNLFALNDQKWRDMRSTLSPAFTSSKMKFMFSLIVESSEQFIKHFLKQKEEIIDVEMRDILSRFASDVIANTAFGVRNDCLEEKDNEFYCMAKESIDFTGLWRSIKLFGFFVCPQIFKRFDVNFFSQKASFFFRKLVKDNIQKRKANNIIRNDMIHLLMEQRKTGLKVEDFEDNTNEGFATAEQFNFSNKSTQKAELTDEDITAQALIFFFAGFDSVSALLSFMAYELAVNPDVQDRLLAEVDETLEESNNKITYDILMKMKYLDMVTSETLRKWAINPATDRVCTIPNTIEPKTPEEIPLHIEKNTAIWIPTLPLHRDPKYFPNPDRFDPERFSDENKKIIKPYTFLPFGVGPRNCIGSRFALMETKALFCHILTQFEIVPTAKTDIPLKVDKRGFSMWPENGFWLGLKKRSK